MQHNNYSMESQKGDSFFSFALKFMISRFTAQSYSVVSPIRLKAFMPREMCIELLYDHCRPTNGSCKKRSNTFTKSCTFTLRRIN